MSQIARDEAQLVEMMMGEGWVPTRDDHHRLILGFVFEDYVKWMLEEAGLATCVEEQEVVAGFDERFRGHPDGVLEGGAVVEIKSTVEARRMEMKQRRRASGRHFEAMQMNLHHGGYAEGYLVYIARDSGQYYVHRVRPVASIIERLNAKAQRVLAAVDLLLDQVAERGEGCVVLSVEGDR